MSGGILGSGNWTKQQLIDMPTIRSTHTADLKVETDTERVWVSRLTKRDGASVDHRISVEKKTRDGQWR